jgi:glycosyltransferase involved in cell wall biosynthesis
MLGHKLCQVASERMETAPTVRETKPEAEALGLSKQVLMIGGVDTAGLGSVERAVAGVRPERLAASERVCSQGAALDDNRTLPLVSIITPAYNRAGYLTETIDSILSQDYPRIEYIVLDDGSTDGTPEVLARYGSRIRWETHPNMGETRTVNRGLALAHGDIVAVVNSDDPLLPGAVRAAVGVFLERPDVLVVYPDWLMIDADSKPVRTIQVPDYDYALMVRRFRCIVGPGAFMRRRAVEAAGGRDAEYRFVADFDFWLRVGLLGPFARIPHVVATFRVHPASSSVSQRGQAMADEHVRLARQFFARADLSPAVRAFEQEALSWAFYYAGFAASPPSLLSWGYFAKAIVAHPASACRKWRLLAVLVVPRRLQGAVRSLWWRIQAAVRHPPTL